MKRTNEWGKEGTRGRSGGGGGGSGDIKQKAEGKVNWKREMNGNRGDEGTRREKWWWW